MIEELASIELPLRDEGPRTRLIVGIGGNRRAQAAGWLMVDPLRAQTRAVPSTSSEAID